jgi:hypothetical protein
MGPYHAIMVHFPVAFWTVAALTVIFRALSDRPLARAFDRVLVATLVMGVCAGVVAYTLGQFVWPPATLQATPLGRNHMMGATWTLTSWSAVLFLRWRCGERVWESRASRAAMLALGGLGVLQLMVTGTIGGHLHGAPAYVGEILRMLGLDLYRTGFVPNWVLAALVMATVAMPVLAFASTRGRDAPRPPEGSR